MEDKLTTSPAGFDKTGDILYFIDSRGRDTGALKTINLKTGEEKLIAENPLADVGGIMAHPTENTIQGVSFNYDRTKWQFFDKDVEADYNRLKQIADGEIEIVSRTLDDRKWLVGFVMDDGPVRYYFYDRDTKEPKFLFSNRKDLEGQPLEKMHSVVIDARDGLKLVSYLTLPPGTDPNNTGRPDKPVPLVLDVHGGPWARDDWGFNPDHQLWANRGYAVLSVNYRGSTGFGKKFANAANKEWAGKMHDDLIDAVNWAVKEKIADPIQSRHHRRQLRRLRHAGRPDLHARRVRLRRRRSRPVRSGHAVANRFRPIGCPPWKCSKIASAIRRPTTAKNFGRALAA